MHVMEKSDLSELLRAIAADLDIPTQFYEDAVVKYTDIGEWLAQEDSELAKFEPDIFPQGSFRLGTMVRPIDESGEYDIDLVCHLKIKKENTTQEELKDRVGKRLKARDDIKQILKPSRRCWRLDYPEPFHLDVLPVIPNVERLPNGILLTDTDLRLWQISNPIDYAEWFKGQMKVMLMERLAAYAREHEMSIEEVPEYEVKTPLQQVVQILKRHRDVYFKMDLCNRPVSIVITTLAAKAYANQANLYEALVAVATRMHEHIEKRADGKWWVANPVDEGENFADKWNEYPERREAFFRWLEKLRDDFVVAARKTTLLESAAALQPTLGRATVSRAAANLGVRLPGTALTATTTTTTANVPALGDTKHCHPPIWPLSLQYNVSIKGTVHSRCRSSRTLWKLGPRPVPRGVWLRFEASTNAPRPYEIRWQVVNTGQDALADNGLRGDDFEPSEGPMRNVRWEHSEYRGTHWIEAFVVHNGRCIARSQPFKVKIRQ